MLPSEEHLSTQTIDEMYEEWLQSPQYFDNDASAFYQHMPTLRLLARDRSVLELGVRYGVSTVALLAGKPESVMSVDVEPRYSIPYIEKAARKVNIPFQYYVDNDLTFIDNYEKKYDTWFPVFDLTFIDTLHTYRQLQTELLLYAPHTAEYIVMHDVVSFGMKNEDNAPGKQGLIPAISEFLEEFRGIWSIAAIYHHNNGLMILKRERW